MRQLLQADLAEQTRSCHGCKIISPSRTELILPVHPSPCPLKRGSAPSSRAAARFKKFGKCFEDICDTLSAFLRHRQIIPSCRNFAASGQRQQLVLQAGRKALLYAMEGCRVALWKLPGFCFGRGSRADLDNLDIYLYSHLCEHPYCFFNFL